MGRGRLRLPSGHRASRGHLAWPPLSHAGAITCPRWVSVWGSCCDTSRHRLQEPGGKRPLQWANTPCSGQLPGQGQDPGLGAGATLVRTQVPQGLLPGAAQGTDRQTDSSVSTHGHLTDTAALVPPHPGLTPLTSRLRWGSAPGGCQGLLEERRGQPSSRPSPAHGSAPTRPCRTLEPRAEGAALSPPLKSPCSWGSSTHRLPPNMQVLACSFAMLRGTLGPRSTGSAAARAPEQPLASPAPHTQTPPYLLFSPAPPAVLALGSLRKDKKEEEGLKSMITIANLLTVNAICSLTGKMLECEYERERSLPGRAGKPAPARPGALPGAAEHPQG